MSDYVSKEDALNILYNTFEEYNMTTDKQDKHGGFGAEVFKRVRDIPTLDEKEIIRKLMERIITRLNEEVEWAEAHGRDEDFRNGRKSGFLTAKRVVKEECGINE